MKQVDLSELRDQFDAMLNEVYGPCNVAGMLYQTPDVWEAVDPGSYEMALEQWVDGRIEDGELIEKNGELYEVKKQYN